MAFDRAEHDSSGGGNGKSKPTVKFDEELLAYRSGWSKSGCRAWICKGIAPCPDWLTPTERPISIGVKLLIGLRCTTRFQNPREATVSKNAGLFRFLHKTRITAEVSELLQVEGEWSDNSTSQDLVYSRQAVRI
jgi:hypothetical protein